MGLPSFMNYFACKIIINVLVPLYARKHGHGHGHRDMTWRDTANFKKLGHRYDKDMA